MNPRVTQGGLTPPLSCREGDGMPRPIGDGAAVGLLVIAYWLLEMGDWLLVIAYWLSEMGDWRWDGDGIALLIKTDKREEEQRVLLLF